MSNRKYLTEFCLNMEGKYTALLQQSELAKLKEKKHPPFHIYMICRRPRITLDPSVVVTPEMITGRFFVQRRSEIYPINFAARNELGTSEMKLATEYPFTDYSFRAKDGDILQSGKAAVLLATILPQYVDALDSEVLYIGQSYGIEGSRTATERLINHSTLQSIYAAAQSKTPDQEIWLMLWHFEEWFLVSMDGRKQEYEQTLEADDAHMLEVIHSEMSEQQKINFTEAALIKYFQPEYNKIFKEHFPNPAHKTYSECYDIDLNAVAVQVATDHIQTRLWSHAISPDWTHLPQFELHSREERQSMFDF